MTRFETFDVEVASVRSREDGHIVTAPAPPTIPSIIGAANADFDTFSADLANPDGTKDGGVNTGLGFRRSYNTGGWPVSFAASAAGSDAARGVASYWSCYPSLPAVVNGSLDATITAFFNSIPAGHTMFITVWHEPDVNGKFTSGEYADFRTAQAHMWDLLQASSADTNLVKFGPLLTQSGYRNNGAVNWFPANGKYDFCGGDCYEFRRPDPLSPPDNAKLSGQNGGYGFSKTPSQLAQPFRDFATTVGKPMLVGELGIHPDPAILTDRGTRLQAWMDFFDGAANGCYGVALFHSGEGESGPWWWDSLPNWSYPNCTRTLNSPVLTGPSGSFRSTDVGTTVTGTGIPTSPAPTVISFQSTSKVTMSGNATSSGTTNLEFKKKSDHTLFPDPTTMEKIRDIMSLHAVNPG